MGETRNPREHYVEAERLAAVLAYRRLNPAARSQGDDAYPHVSSLILAEEAQIHATLATVDVQALSRLRVRTDHEATTDAD
jgi:hypothetical protein